MLLPPNPRSGGDCELKGLSFQYTGKKGENKTQITKANDIRIVILVELGICTLESKYKVEQWIWRLMTISVHIDLQFFIIY
jgi:hypothetical protein